MPDIELLIQTQRIICLKRYLENYASSWKLFLKYYLKNLGGDLLFNCNFELSKLSLNMTTFYKECLQSFSNLHNDNPVTSEEIANQIIWNNKYICIDKKSVLNKSIYSKGIIKISDLYEENRLSIFRPNLTLIESFQLRSIIDAMPTTWKQILRNTEIPVAPKKNTVDSNCCPAVKIKCNNELFFLSTLTSKKLYSLFLSKKIIPPTAKKKYETMYTGAENKVLDWTMIYEMPFKCALDTKIREFQYKILNRIVFTKSLLYKIGKKESPLCSFCSSEEETLEHLLFRCTVVESFWTSLQNYFAHHDLYYKKLKEVDVIFGITEQMENQILINHILLLAKYYIYKCSLNDWSPNLNVFLKRLKTIYKIELKIATYKNKLSFHYGKWNKLLPQITAENSMNPT